MFAAFKNEIPTLIARADEFAKQGRENQKLFLTYSLTMFRKALLQTYSSPELARMTESEQSFFMKFSAFVNGSNILEITEELNKAIYHIERNAYPKLLFLDLSLKLGSLLKVGKQVAAKV